MEEAVDQLHAAPLEEFVGERKRLAKELRGAGEREAAAELAKLPKPTPPAWALNNLARSEPEAVAEWLDAAEGLRAATAGADRSNADDVRAAIAAHRDATRSLLAAVRDRTRPNGRELSEPMLDRARDLLGVATADPEAAERLRAGRVVEGEDDLELLWGGAADAGAGAAAKPPAAKPPAAKPKAAKATTGSAKGDAAAERRAAKEREAAEKEAAARAELERLVAEAEAKVEELQAAAEERATAAEEAAERLEEAQRTLHRTESEADAARAAAAEAQDAAEQAERELRTLAAKLES